MHDPEFPSADPPFDPPPIPTLTEKPITHPDSCVGLSSILIDHLIYLLPRIPSLTLSIGSGTGLLEALLSRQPSTIPAIRIIGIEVAETSPSPNKYLPWQSHQTVSGTRFLSPLAAEARAWMFVYPRRVGLVEEYLREHGGAESKISVVVWIGPGRDWEDYEELFVGDTWDTKVNVGEEVGIRAYEILAVARRIIK